MKKITDAEYRDTIHQAAGYGPATVPLSGMKGVYGYVFTGPVRACTAALP